jgi:hypothetical protein
MKSSIKTILIAGLTAGILDRTAAVIFSWKNGLFKNI